MVRERMASSGATFKAVVNEVMRGGIAASLAADTPAVSDSPEPPGVPARGRPQQAASVAR